MNLDSNLKEFLDNFNRTIQPADDDIGRHRLNYLHFSLYHAGWPVRLPRIEDIHVKANDGYEIPIRIYTPIKDKKLPCLLYFHGGGWQKGDLATHDSICRNLAYYSQCIIVAVEWRLAPEHQFPTGIYDCLYVYQWLLDNGQLYNIIVNQIGIGGDSAGGNITAAVFQKINMLKIYAPIFQLLLYPSLDFSCKSDSYHQFSTDYFLTTAEVKRYIATYLPLSSDKENPLASPILQQDFSYLPRTHIVSCGFDPLKDDAKLYAQKLNSQGVSITSKCYDDMIHAFLHMNHTVPRVNQIFQEIGKIVNQALTA